MPIAHASSPRVGAPHTRLVGVVNFGRHRKCRVKLHWNRKVHGRRLKRGQYLLLLEAYTGRKIIDATDAVAFTERR